VRPPPAGDESEGREEREMEMDLILDRRAEGRWLI